MKKGSRTTSKNKIFFLRFSLISLIVIILSIRITVLLTPENEKKIEPENINVIDKVDNDENELVKNNDTNKKESIEKVKTNITIYHGDHSIYNGTDIRTIVQRFTEAIGQGPVKEERVTACCGGYRRINYELQNDNHFVIELTELTHSQSMIEEMSLLQSAFHNGTGNFRLKYAKNQVLEIVTNFLFKFGVDLESHRITTSTSKNNDGWTVDIHQRYNFTELNSTGFYAFVSKENGEIRTMRIGDWYNTKSPIYENISIEDGKNIIYQEIEENEFNFTVSHYEEYFNEELNTTVQKLINVNYTFFLNTTDINFSSYFFKWGKFGYTFDIYLQMNETAKCIYQYVLNVEDGKKLVYSYESEFSGNYRTYYENILY